MWIRGVTDNTIQWREREAASRVSVNDFQKRMAYTTVRRFQSGGRPVVRILVVDDNRDTANSLCMLLQLTGSVVDVAHDGRAALEAMGRCAPDVAILDIGMPDMDGYELARRTRAEPALNHVLLVALTGRSEEEDLERSRQAGFAHHLVKPVRLAVLETIIASAPSCKRGNGLSPPGTETGKGEGS
jgi:CheY-like chemotaxis protein